MKFTSSVEGWNVKRLARGEKFWLFKSSKQLPLGNI